MHPRSETHEKHSRTSDWFLESFVGQLVYRATKKKTAWYPEEQDDFVVPEKYLKTKGKSEDEIKEMRRKEMAERVLREREQDRASEETIVNDGEHEDANPNTYDALHNRVINDAENGGKKNRMVSEKVGGKVANKEEIRNRDLQDVDLDEANQMPPEDDPNIVTWYGPKDPANPYNFSVLKKCFITFELCILTFSIYIGSAIYSPGYESLNRDFGVNSVVATLGLTLFVVGYGVGPLFLAPLSEIPAIGRTPPYVITLAIFVALQPITATVQNFAGLMVLRFLAGFIGSPVLATGGASLGDMFSPKTRPYAIGVWGLAAVQGPVLGPLLGGFAIQAKSWRWAFWILLWLDGACLIMLIFFFPETSSANILLRRAQRLRKRTGNENLRSQSEIMASQMTGKDIVKNTLWMPLYMSVAEPICFFLNLYIGLVYAILYVWIESFQLVFVEIYGFNLGENGLAYMGLFVGALVTYAGFCVYNAKVFIPKMRANGGELAPEARLPVAIFGSLFLPICMFSFGATSLPSIHWMVPIVCSSLFSVGVFLLFQSVLNYLQDAYPEKAASVLAGNDFFRSCMAAGFPLFAPAMFNNLGFHVFWGCVLLGCLTILFIPIPIVLYKYGRSIRMKSKYARHDI